MRGFIILSLLASFLAHANAECANACSGHGKCTSYDMCICNRNWQANDCSERVCQFGLAHVDTPKVNIKNRIDALPLVVKIFLLFVFFVKYLRMKRKLIFSIFLFRFFFLKKKN